MLNSAIIAVAMVLLGGLLYFERKENQTGKLLTKTPLSALFIIAACLQVHPNAKYAGTLLVGLVFCMGGDILLIFPQRGLFFLGLISFLLGHISYTAAIVGVSQVNFWTGIGAAVSMIVSSRIFMRFAPHLGSMKMPVFVYVIVITLMLCAAWSILGGSTAAYAGKFMVFAGALSFYISDIFVARQRFLTPAYSNRLFGLPLYYFGQFLLAFSTGIIPNIA